MSLSKFKGKALLASVAFLATQAPGFIVGLEAGTEAAWEAENLGTNYLESVGNGPRGSGLTQLASGVGVIGYTAAIAIKAPR